jgi:hypothetical protein
VAHRYIGMGTEGICMGAIGDAIAEYLECAPDVAPTQGPNVRRRGRLLNNTPADHLK